jgi:hypothetical protein
MSSARRIKLVGGPFDGAALPALGTCKSWKTRPAKDTP